MACENHIIKIPIKYKKFESLKYKYNFYNRNFTLQQLCTYSENKNVITQI